MISKSLLDSVKHHEGWRDKAYQDTEGVWTIGYGTNLQELTISKETGERWLREQLEVAQDAATRFPEWEYLNTAARREVFVEMIYNMGPSRVAGFRKTLAAIRRQEWYTASTEMLDSKWARQVGQRANTLAAVMWRGRKEALSDN